MSDLFILLLGRTPDDILRWGEFRDGRLIEGGRLENAEALRSIAARAGETQTLVAILPGEQVTSRQLPSAPRGSAKMRAAASYLMEDELGEVVDNVMVGVSTGQDGAVAFAAKRSIIEQWLGALGAHGLECDYLSADYLLLASTSEVSTIVSDGERVVAAIGGTGFALERGMFSDLASQLLADPPARIRALGDDALRRMLPKESALDWLGAADEANLLALYGAAATAAQPPTFLQRRLIKRKAIVAQFAPWRRAAALAAGLVGVLFVGAFADGVRASRIADRWQSAAADIHSQYFPEASSSDPVAYARQRLADGAGGGSFMFLASRFADAIENNEAVQIDRIRYNAARGDFAVSVTSETDVAIEELKTALAAAGVIAEDSGGYRNNGDVWSGELTARPQ